jgi:hypothetical protein
MQDVENPTGANIACDVTNAQPQRSLLMGLGIFHSIDLAVFRGTEVITVWNLILR